MLQGTASGPAAGMSFSLQTGKHLISIRAIKEYEFIIWNGDKYWEEYGDVDLPGKQHWDMGLLYGRISKPKYLWVSFSAGLGLVGGVQRGKFLAHRPCRGDVYEKRAIRTVGIPVEVHLVKRVFDFGLGLYGYGNLNPEASFAGVLLFLQLGKLQ